MILIITFDMLQHIARPTRAAALLLPLLAPACGGDPPALATESDAQDAAEALTGGTARSAERTTVDGRKLWAVDVAMGNGATVEVLLFPEDGTFYKISDEVGPFDYALDPLPGKLDYGQAQTIAFDVVDGAQQAWLVKWDDGPYFYEFYIEDVDAQLWEVKLWADDGEVFATEAVDAVD